MEALSPRFLCKNCRAPCDAEFKKVIDLKTGLSIFVPLYCKEKTTPSLMKLQEDKTFIFHNNNPKELKRPDFIKELCQYKTRCFQCRYAIHQASKLLESLNELKSDEVVGICTHCKRNVSQIKCPRCLYLVSKYKNEKKIQDETLKFKEWFQKFKELLLAIIQSERCKEQNDPDEFEKMLMQFREPLIKRWVDCTPLDSLDFLDKEGISTIKEFLSIIANKSSMNFDKSSACPCKMLQGIFFPNDDKIISTHEDVSEDLHNYETQITKKAQMRENTQDVENDVLKTDVHSVSEKKSDQKSHIEGRLKTDDHAISEKTADQKSPIEGRFEKVAATQPKGGVKNKTKTQIKEKKQVEGGVGVKPLPMTTDEEMWNIKNELRRMDRNVFSVAVSKNLISSLGWTIHYQLSDRKFINNGWTILPEICIVKELHIFKASPVTLVHDWFKINREYEYFEEFAKETGNGDCIWFYKDGQEALHYFHGQGDSTFGLYAVLSSTIADTGDPQPSYVLALFDTIGNGVVYDCHGKTRLRYNQTEGQVEHERMDFLETWKWHLSNEPPIIKTVMVNKLEKIPESCLGKLPKEDKRKKHEKIKSKRKRECARVPEYVFFPKPKPNYQPCNIRPRMMRINKNFSLNIVNQQSIWLKFSDGCRRMRLNLGVALDVTQVHRTTIYPINEVRTTFDNYCPKRTSADELCRIFNELKEQSTLDLIKLV